MENATSDTQMPIQDFEKASHSRFKGASWYGHQQDIVIGGAGGIGSWLSLMLARAGHSLYVYDFDDLEEHNLGGQLYSHSDVGQSKVEALASTIYNLSQESISTYNEKYTKDNGIVSPVMFACFDNMEARKVMFEKWLATCALDGEPFKGCIFIDGRLNAETAEIFCISESQHVKRWLTDWFPDEKVEDAPCTFKATSHCAAILAGMMVACLNNFISNKFEGEERSVPYKTSIWLPTMMVKTEEL